MTEKCPGCGGTHDEVNCDHDAENNCHRTTHMACPHHFWELSGETLGRALPGHVGTAPGFMVALEHLNGHGYVQPAYLTWAALLWRYAMPEGMSVEKDLSHDTMPVLPDEVPEQLRQTIHLVNVACRAAMFGDGQTVLDTFEVVQEMGPHQTVSFLASVAASARMAVETNDACTEDMLLVYHLLGSQTSSPEAYENMPFLAEMVRAAQLNDGRRVVAAMNKLCSKQGATSIVAAVDVVSRALGQLIHPEAFILAGSGDYVPDSVENVMGLLDWRTADPAVDGTPEGAMPGVWAIRTAEAYVAAQDERDATDRLQALTRQHPDGQGAFAIDVVLGGVQMLGNVTQDRPVLDVPPGHPG